MLERKEKNRRNFLKQSSLITAGSMYLPMFLGCSAKNYGYDFNGKRLVVIQLSGGNDGLNTIIPFHDDEYYRLRPGLSLKKYEVIALNDELGLNPGMIKMKEMYDEGDVCIINNVGYPNPSRSHFRSMDIWHAASGEERYLSTGWIGRYLDNECRSCNPYEALELNGGNSLALKGKSFQGFSLTDPRKMHQIIENLKITDPVGSLSNDNLSFLYKTLADTKQCADYIYEKSKVFKSKQNYPQKQLGRKLKSVAELIISGIETKFFYVSFTGFDTHANQKGKHQHLLNLYSESMAAFSKDLKAHGEWENTIVLTFSEFGRRVKENAGKGTDHGAAGNVLIAGGGLKKSGIYNESPDLNSLEKGDLVHTIDFRSIYATLIDRWMEGNSQNILSGYYPPLHFI